MNVMKSLLCEYSASGVFFCFVYYYKTVSVTNKNQGDKITF